MISIEAYQANPCKALSIPYWKAKRISIPSIMRIVHDSEFDDALLQANFDRKFFRLIHRLVDIPEFYAPGAELEIISPDRVDELVSMINRSYSEIRVSADEIKSLTATPVYCPELWIGAALEGTLIGSILCDFDAEAGEGVIEWLQVLPEYRGRGVATALICRVLRTMRGFADFATVSGECDNLTKPERVYRRCGFEGNDVWHILHEKQG